MPRPPGPSRLTDLANTKFALGKLGEYLTVRQRQYRQLEAIDPFGEDEDAVESRRPKNNDSLGVKLLKHLLQRWHEIDGSTKTGQSRRDSLLRQIVKQVETNEKMFADHFKTLFNNGVKLHLADDSARQGPLSEDDLVRMVKAKNPQASEEDIRGLVARAAEDAIVR